MTILYYKMAVAVNNLKHRTYKVNPNNKNNKSLGRCF